MPERGMAQVMSEASELNQVQVDPLGFILQIARIQQLRDPLGYLRNFQRVREPISKEVRLVTGKELGLSLETTKACRVQESAVVTTEGRPSNIPLLAFG